MAKKLMTDFRFTTDISGSQNLLPPPPEKPLPPTDPAEQMTIEEGFDKLRYIFCKQAYNLAISAGNNDLPPNWERQANRLCDIGKILKSEEREQAKQSTLLRLTEEELIDVVAQNSELISSILQRIKLSGSQK